MRALNSNSARRNRQGGFSLLEMVVAIAVMAMALAMLYQAASGATRNVRSDEQYAYGVELARSLLARHDVVPVQGVSSSGETAGGFQWSVTTAPAAFDGSAAGFDALQDIVVRVSWPDGLRRREVVLHSVVGSAAL